MSTVNYTNPNQDRTVTIFDEFYSFKLEVDVNLYDVVLSFFSSIFSDELAAKNFTLSLFRISESSGVPVLTLLDEMKGQDQLKITATLGYYLNNLRSNSTLLGIRAAVTPNFYAARNVLT